MYFTQDGAGYRLFVDKVLTGRKTPEGTPEIVEVEKVEITTFYGNGQILNQFVNVLEDYPELSETIGEQIYKFRKGLTGITGTPLNKLPNIDAFLETKLQSNGLSTLEALADANELVISKLGRGGMQLKEDAKNYLLLHGRQDSETAVVAEDPEKEQMKKDLAEAMELIKQLTAKKSKKEE